MWWPTAWVVWCCGRILSGKQNASGVFQPPAATHVRKAVLLATPNFGTPLASLPIASLLGFTEQLNEMASGSSFLFGLGTWNQGTDDLRGVDAVAAAGNAGIGGWAIPLDSTTAWSRSPVLRSGSICRAARACFLIAISTGAESSLLSICVRGMRRV